jgi:hypothetical protein
MRPPLLFCPLVLIVALRDAVAVPVITEFMADNASGLTDAAGRHSDWIEIHNPSGAPQDMTGWHLTDNANALTKWTFPAKTIPAGGRLVVFASGDGIPDTSGALHTNFSLDAGGEYLALVAPDGVTKASEFAPYPAQREDVSYGVARQRTELIAPGASGKAVAASDSITGDWHGGAEPFPDNSWSAVTNGIGYNRTEQPVIPLPSPETVALHVPSGTVGNQSYGGSLGMDFSVERPLTVTALGAFDSGGNGFAQPIRVQLWTRDERGTPDNFADDTGMAVLSEFTLNAANPGQADGGSRFINLAAPLTLPVGTYTIVASGYGAAEPNGNSGISPGPWSMNTGNGAITFDGGSRFGTAGLFPGTVDGGPANRYAAGTFKFTAAPADLRRTAYNVATGTVGTQAYALPLGMDFKTTRTIRVTSLGVFDSGSNGLSATLTAQLWQRNENGTPDVFTDDTGAAVLGALTFTTASPGTLVSGNRFKQLPAPIDLPPGAYTIAAYGYTSTEPNGNSGGAAPAWTTDGGLGNSVLFVGTSRHGNTAGAFPETPDLSPANRYAAGTFQYFDGSDPLVATSMDAAMFGISSGACFRIPFNVTDAASIGSLELEMAWDDGFSAWLNGVPLASRRAPATLSASSTATSAGAEIENIVLPPAILTNIRSGANILAIHGLNITANDSDFLSRARLSAVSAASQSLYFPVPTPGGPESTGVSGFVEPVTFSVPHGFYEAPFTVTLSSPTAGAEIRYTTNGSDPTATSALYTAPVPINTTTPLRAAAFIAGQQPSISTTCTYLFLDHVVTQPAAPSGYPTSWNAIAGDYAMEDNATDLASILGLAAGTPVATMRTQLKTSLTTLPAICIATAVGNLFDPASGVYTNPSGRGDLWEKPCSAELIPAPGTTEAGFQINGGIQVMGLTSRNLSTNPRLPLRVIFSRRFGPPSLHYPLYPGNPVTRFDSIALRNNTRDNFGYDPNGVYIRDQWTKETQAAMGVPASSGRFCHLFINGLYWGVYNPTERPDGDYAEEHIGGDADEWDSVTLCCPNRAKSGTLAKWQQVMTLCTQGFETDAKYQFIQGNNPNGTRNPAFEVLVDIDNLIAFLVSGYYHASGDWPGNFYAIRRRGPDSEGFKFITWDSDLGLGWGNPSSDKTGNDSASWWSNSPGQLDLALRAHPEYRLRVADAVQRHYFNGGLMTPAVASARWSQIAQAFAPAMAAEGARWGDARSPLGTVPRWQNNRNFYTNSWFPNRTNTVLTQLRNRGLFPSVNAPVLNQHGGSALPGFAMSMTGTGTLYYTLNGTDPRQWGGAPAPGALTYSSPVPLNATTTVRARALSGNVWSALTEAVFLISPPASASTLVITEIYYNPSGTDDAEYIELMNTGATAIDLSGVRFTVGLEYTFPAGTTLDAGARILVVRNQTVFTSVHGGGLNVSGEFQNLTNLDNGGEHLTLLAANGSVIADFTYDDDAPWPNDTDGNGFSLTLINPAAHPDYSQPANWRASSLPGGTPGTGDATTFAGDPAADVDGDGLSARLEYALGTSDSNAADGESVLRWDAATGTLILVRALAADDAILTLESSSDLSTWDQSWTMTRRLRTTNGQEELRYTPPPDAASRAFLRARLP